MEKKGEGLLNGKKNDPIEKKKKTFWLKKTIKVLQSSDEPIKIIIIDYW
jgi:hypothetical protein